MFEVRLGGAMLEQVKQSPDEPGDGRPRADLSHAGGVREVVTVHWLPG